MTGDRVIRLATAAVVCAVAAFAAVVSYSHIYGLGRAHGQDGTAARLVPLSVDGLILAASLVLHPPSRDPQQVRRGHHRRQRPLGPAPVLQERREIRPGPQLRDRQLDRPRPGVPLPAPVPVPGVHPVRCHLAVPRVTPDLDISVHHPLRELPDHLPQHIRARRCQGLLELRAGNRHNVTYGHFALLRLELPIPKDREVAASHHGDTPD